MFEECYTFPERKYSAFVLDFKGMMSLVGCKKMKGTFRYRKKHMKRYDARKQEQQKMKHSSRLLFRYKIEMENDNRSKTWAK